MFDSLYRLSLVKTILTVQSPGQFELQGTFKIFGQYWHHFFSGFKGHSDILDYCWRYFSRYFNLFVVFGPYLAFFGKTYQDSTKKKELRVFNILFERVDCNRKHISANRVVIHPSIDTLSSVLIAPFIGVLPICSPQTTEKKKKIDRFHVLWSVTI